jgi:hypothetical protein
MQKPEGADGPQGPAPTTAFARATEVVGGLARAATRMGLLALAAGALVWWAAFDPLGAGRGGALARVVVGVLLAAPPAILLLFAWAARTLARLPRKVREAPTELRARAEEVRRRAAEIDVARARGHPLRALGSTLRLWWTISTASSELVELAPAAFLLSPWMALSALVALPLAALEIGGGAVSAIALLL